MWSVLLYGLAALSFDVLMDRWCPALFEKVYRIKREGLGRLVQEEPDRPLLVMLGSSRTQVGFQAGRLDGMTGPNGRPLAAYNFGVPAAGPIHEYLYLREMLDRGIRPSLLLVEFLPPFFNDAHSRYISEENWTQPAWGSAEQLLRMMPYLARPGRIAGNWLKTRLSPWYAYRYELNGWLLVQLGPPSDYRPVNLAHDRWGCRCPEKLTLRERIERTLLARDFIPALERFQPGAGPIRAMRDLLECCRREGIPVALVLTPESSRFRGWYSSRCQQATRELLGELRPPTASRSSTAGAGSRIAISPTDTIRIEAVPISSRHAYARKCATGWSKC